jgi:hypothetical protein
MNHLKYLKSIGFKKTKKTVFIKTYLHLDEICRTFDVFTKEFKPEYFTIYETVLKEVEDDINNKRLHNLFSPRLTSNFNQLKMKLNSDVTIHIYLTNVSIGIVFHDKSNNLYGTYNIDIKDIKGKSDYDTLFNLVLPNYIYREFTIFDVLNF